jgi:tagaturonate reductase
MTIHPETILQFGAGRFLRAFVDRFVQNCNDAGHAVGSVVVVQSTPGSRVETINRSGEGFHVLVRGFENGELVERVEQVRSISRALTAADAWPQVLELARSPQLRYIVSNATEAGYKVSADDQRNDAPPRTLPGKLTQVLWERFTARQGPLIVLPCELIERNADKLLHLVLSQANDWNLGDSFAAWLADRCQWLNNLVDCMVTHPPADHPLLASDPALVHAEPYALWAIERRGGVEPPLAQHPAMKIVDDLSPFYLRKVRILNGLHTAMVGKFSTSGFTTVQQILTDREAVRWVRGLLYEEIVPTIAWRVDDVAEFADETFDRLRNPFLAHRLADIAMHHADKVRVRLEPTRQEYEKLFGRPPKRLVEAISAGVSL